MRLAEGSISAPVGSGRFTISAGWLSLNNPPFNEMIKPLLENSIGFVTLRSRPRP